MLSSHLIFNVDPYTDSRIFLGAKKPLKIIININYMGNLYYDYYFEIFCAVKNEWETLIDFDERNSKKQYDGTIIYTIDIRNLDCYNFIQIYYYFGEIYFNKIVVEYEETFTSFHYYDYKAKIKNEIK